MLSTLARRPSVLAVAVALALAPAGRAGAQNLVVNPDFEGGFYYFPGTYVPNGYTLTVRSDEGLAGVGQVDLPDGSTTTVFGFSGAGPDDSAILGQSLATAAGTRYQISFSALNTDFLGFDDVLTVTFGGTRLFQQVIASADFTRYTVFGVAAGAATELAFTGYSVPGFVVIDDLSVTAAPLATVPEPGTVALVAVGLAGAAVVRRRRARGAGAD